MPSSSPILEAVHLRKEFPGVVALADGVLSLQPGEVHALLGEHGAGKSTMMKIIAGLYAPDGGELRLGGTVRHFASPADAKREGIATIYQEFSLVPDLSIAENLFLGDEPKRFGLPSFGRMIDDSRCLL